MNYHRRDITLLDSAIFLGLIIEIIQAILGLGKRIAGCFIPCRTRSGPCPGFFCPSVGGVRVSTGREDASDVGAHGPVSGVRAGRH